ncbi:MAG: BBP7 family outer membrane beta-barrel protein [Thermoguttaceae bacterium]
MPSESGVAETLQPEPEYNQQDYNQPLEQQPCLEEECPIECDTMPLCGPSGRFWIRADWMMLWTTPVSLPALVTTGPAGGAPPATLSGGIIGQPGTEILYGNSNIYDQGRAAVRMSMGGWLDRCHIWGFEADWLTLGGLSNHYYQSSSGDPLIARPFFNINTNQNDAQITSYPGYVSGSVDVSGHDYFNSVGVDMRYNLCCCNSCCDSCCVDECGAEIGCCADMCCLNYCRTDLLLGYRHYTLGDGITVYEEVTDSRTGEGHPTRYQLTDNFDAQNEFNGTEIGLNTEVRRGRWSLNLLGKLALGNTHKRVAISGSSVVSQTGSPTQTYNEGILATSSNIGVYTSDTFTVIPQLGVELGYQITCHWRGFVGWNLIYWAPVQRAGEQIDTRIDPRNWAGPLAEGQGTGLPFPSYLNHCTNFWAMGLNVGTEVRF